MRNLKADRRFSGRIFWLAAGAALAIVLALAPSPLAAQGTPASSAAESSATSDAPTDVKQQPVLSDEEKQNQAFRLEGPVVKWTAKTFNLSRENTAKIYAVINFLIVFLAIGVPLFRFLPKFLRSRKEKLSSDIESARKMTEDANTRLSAVESRLSKLDDEIQKFRAEVEAESLQDEVRIKSTLAEESTRIVETAEQEIGVAAAQARRGLRNFAADLAIDQAAKQLALTAETDRALIAEFVGDVLHNSAGGGKN